MKKVHLLIILLLLLLPVTSSLALPPPTETGQQIFIPYATVGDGWWSGVAIHNTSDSVMTFFVNVYKDDGEWVSGSSVTVNPHATFANTLEYFFDGQPPSLRMSPVIRTHTNLPFQATLFVGSTEGGFGFQNYTSSDWVHMIILLDTAP